MSGRPSALTRLVQSPLPWRGTRQTQRPSLVLKKLEIGLSEPWRGRVEATRPSRSWIAMSEPMA